MRTYLTLITPASFYVQLDINYRGGRSSHSPVSGTIGKVFKETLGALPTYIGLKAKYSDYCPPQLVK